MVHAPVAAPASIAVQPSTTTSVAVSASSDASIAAYLAAGEQMRVLSGWVIVAIVGIMLALIAGWATGLLPVTIRLF